MNQGGTKLLSNLVSKTDDPQTLRMVAGALANLCGNGMFHEKLFELICLIVFFQIKSERYLNDYTCNPFENQS